MITQPPGFVTLQVDVSIATLTFTVSLIDKKHDCVLDSTVFDYEENG